jgi:hypothetical protein
MTAHYIFGGTDAIEMGLFREGDPAAAASIPDSFD